jgi:hypothetical protein
MGRPPAGASSPPPADDGSPLPATGAAIPALTTDETAATLFSPGRKAPATRRG